MSKPMGSGMRMQTARKAVGGGHGLGSHYPWLGIWLAPLDRSLRKFQKIEEYSDAGDCIFRIQLISNADEIHLSDGTTLFPGQPLIDLHLWNEQVPSMPAEGPTFGWARQMDHCVAASLRELACSLAIRREFDDVAAVRARVSLVSAAGFDQLARILKRYGFDSFPVAPPRNFAEGLHRLGENILVSLLILATNPAALRPRSLSRDRMVAYMSRGTLTEFHGSHGAD